LKKVEVFRCAKSPFSGKIVPYRVMSVKQVLRSNGSHDKAVLDGLETNFGAVIRGVPSKTNVLTAVTEG
jgi:hypothetical protein